MTHSCSQPGRQATPTFAEATAVWWRIGLLSFGGPAAQIALMHRLLVDERRWIAEARFLHALNFCMLLPGPEAQQLATYVGWLLHGVRGGLVAGVLFVLPGAIVILGLSVAYVLYRDMPLLAALFLGVKAAVLVVVFEAVIRIARRILKNPVMIAIAIIAFVSIYFFAVPFPLIVLGAAWVGWMGVRALPGYFAVLATSDDDGRLSDNSPPGVWRSLRTLLMGLSLWAAPIVLAAVSLAPEHVFVTQGLFFSKLATVTFGGAYAVLAYMAQEAVGVYGWLSAGEMIDGLGLAESTPGPLIMVTQFVGFLGAFRHPGPFEPMTAAVIGSMITVWVTFVPCFLWIFLGAPYVERLRHNTRLTGALSAITAAVVGVIANLAVWFALQVLFRETHTVSAYGTSVLLPHIGSWHGSAFALTAIAAVALFIMHRSVAQTLVVCAFAGAAIHFL